MNQKENLKIKMKKIMILLCKNKCNNKKIYNKKMKIRQRKINKWQKKCNKIKIYKINQMNKKINHQIVKKDKNQQNM